MGGVSHWPNPRLELPRDASAACGVLNTGGNIVGGIGALTVPLMVKSLGWPVALAATSAFALIGAGLWFLIDVDATESLGA